MAGRKNILGVLEKMSSNAVTVRPARCAIVRNRNVTCGKCADACTSECIHLENGTIAVDASKCVGCGTCATVCPTCALETHNPGDLELLQDCQGKIVDGKVTIACEQVINALGEVAKTNLIASVVCLGRVEESLVSGFVAAGAQSVTLLCGDCGMCKQKHGRATAQLVCETSRVLLDAWGSDAKVELVEDVPGYLVKDGCDAAACQEAIGEYFQEERGANLVFADVPVEDAQDQEEEEAPVLRVMRDGTLPHFVPDRRERLLDNLAMIGQPKNTTVNTRLWGYVVIDGTKCSSCRMCATFCPTAAIRKFDEEDGTFGVDHSPIDCVKCGSCRDICPEDAIKLIDDVKAGFLINGQLHHYVMRERKVKLNDPQQIFNTMRQHIDGNMYER